MNGLLVRWLLLTVSIILTSYLVGGIYVASFFSAFFAAVVLGVLNALFRPILIIITLPINILTLGLFTFVINALLLKMASGLVFAVPPRFARNSLSLTGQYSRKASAAFPP